MSIIAYRSPRPRAGSRRQPLTRDHVARAALALLDLHGLDRLTMRALAASLGVKAASLYRHVRDKQDLLALIADEISAAIPMVPRRGSWRDQARAMALTVRRELLKHRDAARVMAESPPVGAHRLRHVEAALSVFRAAGLSKRDAVRAGYVFNNFVTELVADEGRLNDAATTLHTTRRALMTRMAGDFRALPSDQFPTLRSLAAELGRDDFEGLFEFGITVWLDGLERVRRRRARR